MRIHIGSAAQNRETNRDRLFCTVPPFYLYGEADECEPADTSERGSLHPGETKNSVGLNPVPEFIARWAGLGYDGGD
jgi:hypothetical protein